MGNRVKKLLVVDDDLIDAHFVMRAFADVGGGVEIIHVMDSDVAAARLAGETFDYVLLDINMPGMNGIDLLRRIRTDTRTAILPVIMLTSSMNPSDVYTSYASGANAYTLKPSSIGDYKKFAEGFTRFWLDVSVHPYEHKSI